MKYGVLGVNKTGNVRSCKQRVFEKRANGSQIVSILSSCEL